jgi:tetratricopeptide (TPR) repeat protein
MGAIIDEGSSLFAALLVVALSALMQFSQPAPAVPATQAALRVWQGNPYGAFASLLGLAVCVVPAGILLAVLLEPIGSYGVVFRRDYGPLLACALSAWFAAHLPMVPLALAQLAHPLPLWCAGETLFAGLLVFAFRTLYGAGWAKAAGMAVASVASLGLGYFLYLSFGGVLRFLASPFILFYLWWIFRGDFGDIAQSFRNRQSFKRLMEAAALNPHDAEPHYQLGLVYQQRRQYSEAIARFQKAVEIDKTESDAHYQLGRIAREQGRLDDAMRHLETAVKLDDKLSFSEIWREIGATHLAAGRIPEAEAALRKYTGRREYDAEGWYWMGETLLRLNRDAEAKDCFRSCIETVKTSPDYRRGTLGKWSKLASARLKS